jgi:hypothetical protein
MAAGSLTCIIMSQDANRVYIAGLPPSSSLLLSLALNPRIYAFFYEIKSNLLPSKACLDLAYICYHII